MADLVEPNDPVDHWLEARVPFLKAGPRRSLLFYATGATIGLALAGFALFTAKGTSVRTFPPEDVATVNGRHILRSDFIAQIQVESGQPFAQTTLAQREKVLQEMIDEELLVQRGLEVDLAASDPDVRQAMVAGVNLQVDADVLAQQPTQQQLYAYYNQHIDKYSSDGGDAAARPGHADRHRDARGRHGARPARDRRPEPRRAAGADHGPVRPDRLRPHRPGATTSSSRSRPSSAT
ncbi:MAG: SurA N-terminal domain-containing protein [Caulobacteraceae bacterium]